MTKTVTVSGRLRPSKRHSSRSASELRASVLGVKGAALLVVILIVDAVVEPLKVSRVAHEIRGQVVARARYTTCPGKAGRRVVERKLPSAIIIASIADVLGIAEVCAEADSMVPADLRPILIQLEDLLTLNKRAIAVLISVIADGVVIEAEAGGAFRIRGGIQVRDTERSSRDLSGELTLGHMVAEKSDSKIGTATA